MGFLYIVFLTCIERDEGDDVGCYDAFDLHDLNEEEFDHSESEDDVGGISSGSKTSLGFGLHQKFSTGDEKYSLNEELKKVEEKRFICSRCQMLSCNNIPNVTHHFIGTTLVAHISYQAGHAFRFCSSHEVNQTHVNNIQVAAAVLLSGNNFGKVKRLAESMNLAILSNWCWYFH